MNKEQIIALLKQKFQGMRADTLDHLAGAILLNADNEAEVSTMVNKFTEQKLKDYEKDFRSKVDSEVTKAVQTNKENIEKEFDLVKKQEQKKEEEIKMEGQLTAETLSKLFDEKMKPLQQEIATLKGANMLKSRQSQLDSLLKDCKDDNYKKTISETFNYMNTINDEDFGKWTATVTEGVKNANQNLANESLSRQGVPINPNTYGEKGLEKATIEAITKGETSTAVEGKPLIPTK